MSGTITVCNKCGAINWANAHKCEKCGSKDLAPTLRQVLSILKGGNK